MDDLFNTHGNSLITKDATGNGADGFVSSNGICFVFAIMKAESGTSVVTEATFCIKCDVLLGIILGDWGSV